MKLEDCKKGVRVRYVPVYAKGDASHPDCQNGVVSSTNKKLVFVKYDNDMCFMTTGDEPYVAQATRPEDLIER
jgi:CTP:molybdopterin cytidylyltransferase MocA